MRIVLIRATEVMPDPPVEKMANTLISHGHSVTILAWDRSNTYAEKEDRSRNWPIPKQKLFTSVFLRNTAAALKPTSKAYCCFK